MDLKNTIIYTVMSVVFFSLVAGAFLTTKASAYEVDYNGVQCKIELEKLNGFNVDHNFMEIK